MKTRSGSAVAAAAIVMSMLAGVLRPASAEDFDAAIIPRPKESTEIYAGPASKIFSMATTVDAAAATVSQLLSSGGWQGYGAAFSSESTTPDIKLLSFKKGPQLLSVFVSKAPAANNTTNVSYSAHNLVHDLPFPTDATDVKFDTTRPYLNYKTRQPADTLLDIYRKELQTRGWSPWSIKTHAKADNSDEKTEHGARAYYMNAAGSAVSLGIQSGADGLATLTVESIPAGVLLPPKPQAASEQPAPPKPTEQSDASAAIDNFADQMMKEAQGIANDAMKNATKPAPPSTAKAEPQGEALQAMSENPVPIPVPQTAHDIEYDGAQGSLEFKTESTVQQVADFYRSAMTAKGWKALPSVIKNANMSVVVLEKGGDEITVTAMKMGGAVNVTANGSGLAGPQEAAAAQSAASEPEAPAQEQVKLEELAVEDKSGLPIPDKHSSSGTETTLFRLTASASVPASLDVVIAFYRRELPRLGWREVADRAEIAADKASLHFESDAGPGILSLSRSGGETNVALTLRKKREAMSSGLMPAAGKVKILIGNLTEQEVVVDIGAKKVSVKPGVGSKKPDGPTLELPPGNYTFSIKGKGIKAAPEPLSIGPDEIWGLMIGPGGGLALPAY